MIFIRILKFFFPQLIWRIAETSKIIYLTFDDGPIPGVTPWVLKTLSEFNAEATFFCVGENVKNNPGIYSEILKAGHSVGNHTMNHLNGWKTSNKIYFSDIEECSQFVNTNLFRAPYGRMKISQALHLQKKMRLIMWDVLSKDYDPDVTDEECLNNVKRNTKPGSIIVFHDSLKAEKRMKFTLVETLNYYSQMGYVFRGIK